MTTLAPPTIKAVIPAWEKAYPSAVFSGIVGDMAHMNRGGYHVSIEDQSSTNYSVILSDDKAPPGTWPRNLAAALDMSMNKTDMILSTRRWMAVWADHSDPRRRFFRGFNGWLGTGNAQRWDFVKNTVQESTNDHTWHQHTEWRRRYANDSLARDAAISIARGESKATWIAHHPEDAPSPVVVPSGTTSYYVGAVGSRVLRYTTPKPMQGKDVVFLQRWIGGGKLTIDGVFGPKTRDRVIWFQGTRDLKQDGIVGPKTWAQMGIRMS